MGKEKRSRLLTGLACTSIGVHITLEGLQITHFGAPTGNTPYWVVALVGVMFTVAGIAVIMGNAGRWNALAAAIMTTIMGVTMGWVSLFGDASGMSGNASLLSNITGIPFNRILFGLVSLACFIISYHAGRAFIKASIAK